MKGFGPVLRWWRCESGAAMVETALIMPLAVSLFLGVAEFGRALWAYHIADKSMRGAVRYLARLPDDAAINGYGLDRARFLALRGTTDTTATPEPPLLVTQWGQTGNSIVITRDTTAPADHIRLQAVVTYTVPLLQALSLPGAITYTVRHEERKIGE